MSDQGQVEAPRARAAENPVAVETHPAVDLTAATTDKLQSDVYKGPGTDNTRFDFNQAVIAASFSPGSPEVLKDPNNMAGDFRSYRAMMDYMWLGSNKMPGVEREARAFVGVGMLPMPDDKGLQCQAAGADGSQCNYKASERPDKLCKLTRSRTDGKDEVTKQYEGRADHLVSEKYSVERNARGFERTYEAGQGPNGLTHEKYLRSPNSESFERSFDPAKNPDQLVLHGLLRKDGAEKESKSFQARADGLKREERISTAGSSNTERLYEPNAANNGLQSENQWKSKDGKRSLEMKLFDPALNKENIQSENVTKEGGVVTVQRTFKDRADGALKETTEITGNGAISVREFADGTRKQQLLSPDKLKATGINLQDLSTTNDAAGAIKNVLLAKETAPKTDAAGTAVPVAEILKNTVGDKPLNHPSFDGMTPPSPRDKAVMLIGATAGYEGLKQAGLTVDEKTNMATTADGCRYTFEKQADGKLRTMSVESDKNNRKIEFQYKADGTFKGSIETARATDAPMAVENSSRQKYENLELPAIQRGWGPYQALQQMQKEGKIQMSPQEMRQEAVRIRDREFAKLGRDYFKVGEKFQMYSPEELGGKASDSGPVKIHRDAQGNLLKMERGDKSAVTFGLDDKGKPARVSDGIGPDLVSKDGGENWQLESKPGSAERGAMPTVKGKVTVQADKGTVSVQGENKSKLTIRDDGTRTYTGSDGKETVLFRPVRHEVPDNGGPERRGGQRGRRGRSDRSERSDREPPSQGARDLPSSSEYDEGGGIRRGDSSPHRKGAGKPGPDGLVAQKYLNQENSDPEMRAVRTPQDGPIGNMKLRGSPSISAEKIDEVLRKANSPAAKERIKDQETGKELTFGQHLYKLGVEYGVDPAITLAFFKKESGFGKAGAAARNNSVGNIKGDGGFRQYGSFAEGARDWFKLMQDGTYFFKQGRDTVGKVIPKYAPGSDGNDEGGYVRGVEKDVRDWSRSSAHAPERQPNQLETGDRNNSETAERSRERRTRERDELPKPDDSGRPVIEVKAGESIQAALDRAQEGSIIHVQPGVYKERLDIKKDNISLRGDGKAIIDLEGQNTSGAAINISDKKNVAIDGFEIRNVKGSDTPAGIKIDGASRDVAITNNNLHHIENEKNAHGITVLGTSQTAMRNITIAGNDVHHLKLGSSESIAVNGNVDGFRVINNKVHDNDNIGIDVIGFEGVGKAGIDRARNGIISGNSVYNIDTRSNPAYKGYGSAAGIYVDGGSDILIENNTVKNSNYGIELASEHKGRNTARVQVRGNIVEGSHLAALSLGGGSPTNGGVTDSIIENNDFRNNSRPIWRQNNVGAIIERNNDRPLEAPVAPREERQFVPAPREIIEGRVVRDASDRAKFYTAQNDGHSCSAFSMAMMAGDHLMGRPPQYGQEAQKFKALAGTLSHGYRGSLETMAGQLRSIGLEAKAYQYNRFGQQGMQDLNAELDKGHGAVGRVLNPHTGNRHYIYIAGRTAEGNYVLGDPDRGNPLHAQPVSPERLMKMMSGRDGFVAGWAPADSPAASIPGTAAYKRAQAMR